MGLFFLLADKYAFGVGGVAAEEGEQQIQGWKAKTLYLWSSARARAGN